MSAANELAARALTEAQQAGALGAEVQISEQTDDTWQTQSSARLRSTPGIDHSSQHRAACAVRVYLSGGRSAERRVTAARLADLPSRLGGLTAEAVGAAEAAPADPHAGPPDRMDIRARGLSISDPRHKNLTDEDRQDILTWNWGAARSISARLRPQHFTLEERLLVRTFASSRGVSATEQGTRYRVSGAVATSARGDDRVSTGEVVSRHFADIASRPLGAELGNRLEAGDRTTRMPGEALPLVIEPYLVGDILAQVAPAFDAARLEAEQSCLRPLFGTRIAPSGLHIVDDASVAGGLQTRAFDARGVPPIPVPLLRDGVPTGVYLGPEQARRRDTRPTGHAGPGGALWAGNLLLRPGTRTRNMLFADLSRYLVAVDTIRPPSLDIASGRLVLDVWLLLDGPERSPGKLGAYRIETTLPDFFASVVSIASDQSRFGPTVACTLITEGLPVAEL